MMTRIAVTLALVLAAGTVHAAEALKQLPGESVVSFECRKAYVPEVRQCSQSCEEMPDADSRLECNHACTTRGLWNMSLCREAGAAVAAAMAYR